MTSETEYGNAWISTRSLSPVLTRRSCLKARQRGEFLRAKFPGRSSPFRSCFDFRDRERGGRKPSDLPIPSYFRECRSRKPNNISALHSISGTRSWPSKRSRLSGAPSGIDRGTQRQRFCEPRNEAHIIGGAGTSAYPNFLRYLSHDTAHSRSMIRPTDRVVPATIQAGGGR